MATSLNQPESRYIAIVSLGGSFFEKVSAKFVESARIEIAELTTMGAVVWATTYGKRRSSCGPPPS